jgi:hypothetical protein
VLFPIESPTEKARVKAAARKIQKLFLRNQRNVRSKKKKEEAQEKKEEEEEVEKKEEKERPKRLLIFHGFNDTTFEAIIQRQRNDGNLEKCLFLFTDTFDEYLSDIPTQEEKDDDEDTFLRQYSIQKRTQHTFQWKKNPSGYVAAYMIPLTSPFNSKSSFSSSYQKFEIVDEMYWLIHEALQVAINLIRKTNIEHVYFYSADGKVIKTDHGYDERQEIDIIEIKQMCFTLRSPHTREDAFALNNISYLNCDLHNMIRFFFEQPEYFKVYLDYNGTAFSVLKLSSGVRYYKFARDKLGVPYEKYDACFPEYNEVKLKVFEARQFSLSTPWDTEVDDDEATLTRWAKNNILGPGGDDDKDDEDTDPPPPPPSSNATSTGFTDTLAAVLPSIPQEPSPFWMTKMKNILSQMEASIQSQAEDLFYQNGIQQKQFNQPFFETYGAFKLVKLDDENHLVYPVTDSKTVFDKLDSYVSTDQQRDIIRAAIQERLSMIVDINKKINEIQSQRTIDSDDEKGVKKLIFFGNQQKLARQLLRYPQNSNLENYFLLQSVFEENDMNQVWGLLESSRIRQLLTPPTDYNPRNVIAAMVMVARSFNTKETTLSRALSYVKAVADYFVDNQTLTWSRLYSDLQTLINRTNPSNFDHLSLDILNIFQTFLGYVKVTKTVSGEYVHTESAATRPATTRPAATRPPSKKGPSDSLINKTLPDFKKKQKRIGLEGFVESMINGSFFYKEYVSLYDRPVRLDGTDEKDVRNFLMVQKKQFEETSSKLPLTQAVIKERTLEWLQKPEYRTDSLPSGYILGRYTTDEFAVLAKENRICEEIAELTDKLEINFPNVDELQQVTNQPDVVRPGTGVDLGLKLLKSFSFS